MQDATTLARRIVTTFGLAHDLHITTFEDLPPTAGMGAVYNMWKKFSGSVRPPLAPYRQPVPSPSPYTIAA
eukprot:7812739-Pyramimonas_sp.AAC.1